MANYEKCEGKCKIEKRKILLFFNEGRNDYIFIFISVYTASFMYFFLFFYFFILFVPFLLFSTQASAASSGKDDFIL